MFKEIYIFENSLIHPEKALVIIWIDHKLRAMGKLNCKFGIYADTMKQCDCAILQCNYNKLTVANVFLCNAFLSKLLLPAKTLGLATQKENIDIITIANLVR